MALLDFNADDAPKNDGDFEPMPAGWYPAVLSESKITQKDDSRARLAVTFDIIEPSPYAGRKVFGGFNLKNPSEKAVTIAKAQLAELVFACGKSGMIKDSDELHHIPVQIKLKVKPAKDGFEAGSEFQAFKPIDGDAPHAPSTNGKDATPPSAGAPASAPWGR